MKRAIADKNDIPLPPKKRPFAVDQVKVDEAKSVAVLGGGSAAESVNIEENVATKLSTMTGAEEKGSLDNAKRPKINTQLDAASSVEEHAEEYAEHDELAAEDREDVTKLSYELSDEDDEDDAEHAEYDELAAGDREDVTKLSYELSDEDDEDDAEYDELAAGDREDVTKLACELSDEEGDESEDELASELSAASARTEFIPSADISGLRRTGRGMFNLYELSKELERVQDVEVGGFTAVPAVPVAAQAMPVRAAEFSGPSPTSAASPFLRDDSCAFGSLSRSFLQSPVQSDDDSSDDDSSDDEHTVRFS